MINLFSKTDDLIENDTFISGAEIPSWIERIFCLIFVFLFVVSRWVGGQGWSIEPMPWESLCPICFGSGDDPRHIGHKGSLCPVCLGSGSLCPICLWSGSAPRKLGTKQTKSNQIISSVSRFALPVRLSKGPLQLSTEGLLQLPAKDPLQLSTEGPLQLSTKF